MALQIRGEIGELPEHGWGVVGEKLGNASTESLYTVLPLDRKDEAVKLTSAFRLCQRFDKFWFTESVSLSRITEDGTAVYVEASNLTHPGQRY